MNQARRHFWTGVALIFGAYYYFLIFAQFAFLNLVNESHPSEATLRLVMGIMAVGGLVGSVLVPILRESVGKSTLLRFAFGGCAATLAVNWLPSAGYFSVAFFIGLFLGVATVGIASSLRAFFGSTNWAMGTALGTGENKIKNTDSQPRWLQSAGGKSDGDKQSDTESLHSRQQPDGA